MWAILIDAALVVAGTLVLFRPALDRRLSDPHRTLLGGHTLEPRGQGLRFLGISKNWPALALIAIGAFILALAGYW